MRSACCTGCMKEEIGAPQTQAHPLRIPTPNSCHNEEAQQQQTALIWHQAYLRVMLGGATDEQKCEWALDVLHHGSLFSKQTRSLIVQKVCLIICAAL